MTERLMEMYRDWCGYIGGSGIESVGRSSSGLDRDGNFYVTGRTDSTQATFPVKIGPDLFYNGGGRDAYIAMVSEDGAQLYYAGCVGGLDDDSGGSIWVDPMGTVWLAGYTWSDQNSFPVLGGPDLTHNGEQDAFVTKFTSHLFHLPIFSDGFESGDTSAWSSTQ
jgi:hypothetical protein